MNLPWVRRRKLTTTEERLRRSRETLDKFRRWHWARCGCHDSWDQCPCASDGHPADGSCGCCDLGEGLCGPKPTKAAAAR